MWSVLSALGESFMSWQQVVVISIMVLGGCFLGFEGKETIAAMILGAAGGFISQPLMKRPEVAAPASLVDASGAPSKSR